jgi:hypothetical protein
VIGLRRWVRYAPELDEQPVGTILSIPGSRITALRNEEGWLLYGVSSEPKLDTGRSLERNLPAVVGRRGKRRWFQ